MWTHATLCCRERSPQPFPKTASCGHVSLRAREASVCFKNNPVLAYGIQSLPRISALLVSAAVFFAFADSAHAQSANLIQNPDSNRKRLHADKLDKNILGHATPTLRILSRGMVAAKPRKFPLAQILQATRWARTRFRRAERDVRFQLVQIKCRDGNKRRVYECERAEVVLLRRGAAVVGERLEAIHGQHPGIRERAEDARLPPARQKGHARRR